MGQLLCEVGLGTDEPPQSQPRILGEWGWNRGNRRNAAEAGRPLALLSLLQGFQTPEKPHLAAAVLWKSLCRRHREDFVASFPPHLPTSPDLGPLLTETPPPDWPPGPRRQAGVHVATACSLQGGRPWPVPSRATPYSGAHPGAPLHRPEEAQLSG